MTTVKVHNGLRLRRVRIALEELDHIIRLDSQLTAMSMKKE